MALQVGELNAILTVDDRTVDPALRRAEQALRASGQAMGSDADRAGEQAGEGLGDGLVRGADGRLRNARGRFVAAGRRAGDAVGDGLADGVGDGADEAVAEAESGLTRLQTIALAAGAAAGAVLMTAFGQAMEQEQITARLGAQLGKTPAEAQRYGKLAGQLYTSAVVADFQTAADTIGSVMGSGLINADATNAEIQKVSTKVADLTSLFGQDLTKVTNAASQLIRTGLAKNSTEALDLIAKGFTTNVNKADDFLDTLNEYSVQFKRVGLDGKTAIGLMTQAIAKGARDSDQVADAIGQFGERALAGGKPVEDAFKGIGLNADTIVAKLKKGGKSGQEALQMTTDALRKTTNETDRLAAAGALFGDPGIVMGDALYALDPASAAAASGMNKATGAADKLGKSVHDTAAANLERFKRGAMQELVDFTGGQVIPVVIKLGGFIKEHSGAFKIAAGVITAVLVPALVLMGVTATVAAGRVMWGWVTAGASAVKGAAIQVGAAARTAGAWAMMKARAVGSFIAMAASATANALRTAAVWAASAARMTATWLVGILRVAAVTVAQFALMAGRAVIWAATMAAQWLIAMGPVGWIIGIVIGLVALIIANWDKVKAYTLAAWTWAVNQIKVAVNGILAGIAWLGQIPGKVSAWFGQMKDWAIKKLLALVAWVTTMPGKVASAVSSMASKLAARAAAAWQAFQVATAKKVVAFIGYVRSLPGKISAGIGSLNRLLVSKGTAVVQGLWSGIQSMGGWIKSKLLGWARSMIPGPIAKALGIASPSKVTRAQGRWIARGLIDGLTGSSKQVKSASTKLADIIRDSLNPGKRRTKGLKAISSGTKQLLKLAGQETKLAARMKAATKSIADQRKARDKLAADVKKGVLDSANITSKDNTGGWPVTAGSILAGLQQDTVAAQTFAKDLAMLRKKGVRADLVAQIAQAGVEQGSAAAAALANANSGQIKQINAQQKLLVSAAGSAGATAGNAMYGAGIDAANGLIRGLQKQQKAIEAQMLKIAKGMSKSIKKALGIKSPSRVMALVGQYTAQGLIRGVEGQRNAVNRSMASLVDTPAPGSWDMASGRARAAASQNVVLELRSSGRAEDDYLVERMRRGIRKKGGGDVDLVLAGRRSG
ncbi:phage tail tape measure protein [Streptomyces sp. NPDC056948]|uniref:phage tail tape measure protein n=1 Tax=Streptomyces sp. NPDC056948 TaxID=3345975 RepID=UPI0036264C8E